MNSENKSLMQLLLLAAVALAGCSRGSKAAGPGGSPTAASSPLATPHASVAVEVFEVQPQVKVEFEKCIIRAPLTGSITHCYTKLGTSIVRNDKLFEVARLSPFHKVMTNVTSLYRG